MKMTKIWILICCLCGVGVVTSCHSPVRVPIPKASWAEKNELAAQEALKEDFQLRNPHLSEETEKESNLSNDEIPEEIKKEEVSVDELTEVLLMPSDPTIAVQSINKFAFQLWEQIRSQKGNIIVSPYGLVEGLSMMELGSQNMTSGIFQKVLHEGMDRKTFAESAMSIHQMWKTDNTLEPYCLKRFNTVWIQKGYALKTDYLKACKNEFLTTPYHVDFKNDWNGSCKKINSFYSNFVKQTQLDLLKLAKLQIPLGGNPKSVMINGVALTASWASPFDANEMVNSDFKQNPQLSFKVAMMTQKNTFEYTENDQWRVLKLPYEKDFHFLVLFPQKEELSERLVLGKGLMEKELNVLTSQMQKKEIQLTIPQFFMDTTLELSEVLSNMGLNVIKNGAVADFSKMTDRRGLTINSIIQKNIFNIDNLGTAKSAKLLNPPTCEIRQEETEKNQDSLTPKEGHNLSMCMPMVLNRPFMFLVRENKSGLIVYIGKVETPTPSQK